MSNSLSDYNTQVRANLPAGMSYNTDVARYQFNGHSFTQYEQAKWYYDYVSKFGYVTQYSVGQYEPNLVLDFAGDFYGTSE